MVVWMNERPLDVAKSYLLKHTTQMVRAEVTTVLGHTDLETLEERPAAGLSLNDIGRVRVETHRALFFDPYAKNRRTGAFVLVDSLTNNTVAAGMIVGTDAAAAASTGDRRLRTQVSQAERRERLGQSGAVVVLSGGAAPAELTELAYAVERALFDARRVATVVTAAGSSGPIVARELARAGLVAIVTGSELHAQGEKDEEPVLKVRVFGDGEAGAGEQGVLSVSLAGAGTEAAAARIVAELLQNEKNG
jgi:bifunctional enzyme CysN/CysC/sulfate adenylyltransferase subunit 1